MSAHVYQSPNSGEAEVWQAKCYSHHTETRSVVWCGPERVHTDAGLALAFKDRDKHNRTDHASPTPDR